MTTTPPTAGQSPQTSAAPSPGPARRAGHPLAAYAARRLAAAVALLLVVSLAVFALLALAPGDLARTLLGTRSATPQALATVRSAHHLDDPFLVQYWHWLAAALHGDLGVSVRTGAPVTQAVGDRVGLTLQLALGGFVLALLAGVPFGTLAALRRGRATDRIVQGLGVVGLSAPAFASGLLLVHLFSLRADWLPAFGAGDGDTIDRLRHLVLPCLTLAVSVTGLLLKLTRAAVLRELDADHTAFALARGVPPREVLLRHVLRGALLPIATGAGLVLAYLVAGTVLVEATFALPGLGRLLVGSVTYKDVPVVQAVALLAAAAVITVNLVVDLLTPLIDPRIRTGGTR
ncbi:ABC transporter permease [Streptomyces sp. NPDC058665]|uniref:ABC transporter permease n=1 Tax=Streptomyces sp. NPDC058665 TaxID=3346586 RepID=UPI00365FA280